jgi:argininosuccinate lyase
MNFCPLGSGAVAGATLALDREIAARELGFDGPTANSMDATSDRDFLLEFTQCLAGMGVHLSRFAEEITLYATAEFGFVELPEAFSTGSSAMPQKKNPDFTELLRGKCARLVGAATTLAMLMKGLPLAYNKDLQEGQEPVFDAADTARGRAEDFAGVYAGAEVQFCADAGGGDDGVPECDGGGDLLDGEGCGVSQGA